MLAGWLGDRPCCSLGVWLARLSETCEIWFTLGACCSPRCASRPMSVTGGGATEPTSVVAFRWLSSGSPAHLAHWEVDASLLSSRVHTDTHPLIGLQPTCCCAARVSACKAAADTPAHSYTNKQTHLLPLTISRRREGEQNKQFHFHDSSLLYISTLWQWWSEAWLEAAGNEKWSSCLLFEVRPGRGSLLTWNASDAVCYTSRRRGFCVCAWCPSDSLLFQSRQ